MKKQNVYIGTDWLHFLQQVLLETQSKKPMLVCGKHILKQKKLLDYISDSQCQFVVFSDFQSNPDYESAINAARIFKNQQCDFMLAVGGGSTIDTAKCARRFSCMDLSKDCLLQAPKGNTIKMFAIPTTAGSGSEATHFAVIYRNNQKYSVSGKDMLPDYVALDPECLYGLPVYQKKSCFLDALCQAVESWWSLKANEESVAYSKKAISLLLSNYRGYFSLFLDERDSITKKAVYESILLGAHYAGKAINITATTAAHAMSYGITKMFGLAHGHAVALCMLQVWRQLLKQNTSELKFVLREISQAFGCVTEEDALEKYGFILKELRMPVLQFVTENDIQQLTETVNIQRLENHPVPLNYNELYFMYKNISQSSEG